VDRPSVDRDLEDVDRTVADFQPGAELGQRSG
jgi:hypothetical protein